MRLAAILARYVNVHDEQLAARSLDCATLQHTFNQHCFLTDLDNSLKPKRFRYLIRLKRMNPIVSNWNCMVFISFLHYREIYNKVSECSELYQIICFLYEMTKANFSYYHSIVLWREHKMYICICIADYTVLGVMKFLKYAMK